METEALYQTFPSYAAAQPRRMLVELTFRRAPTEGDAPAPGGEEGGEGEEAKVAPPAANRDTTVMTVQVGARDSIDSLTKRIRVGIHQISLVFFVMLIVFYRCCYLERGVPTETAGCQASRRSRSSSRGSAGARSGRRGRTYTCSCCGGGGRAGG